MLINSIVISNSNWFDKSILNKNVDLVLFIKLREAIEVSIG